MDMRFLYKAATGLREYPGLLEAEIGRAHV